jgi:hypothetical protein
VAEKQVGRIVKAQKILAGIPVALLLLVCGCQNSRYGERFGFGTMERQKNQAADFDPFPFNDIGPEVVGGRPPGFFNPTPEARRNDRRAQQNAWGGYSQR